MVAQQRGNQDVLATIVTPQLCQPVDGSDAIGEVELAMAIQHSSRDALSRLLCKDLTVQA
jgi:hypothetical protein